MRNKKKAFLSCAIVAAVGLLAPPAAMATGYNSCSNFSADGRDPGRALSGERRQPDRLRGTGADYTGIKYKITGSPGHVATLVTANNTVLLPSGFQAYAACAGDPVTGLGKDSCHEKAIKVNPNSAAAGQFWVVVDETKSAGSAVPGREEGHRCSRSFAISGLGFDVNPFQAAQKVETVNFKGCAVKFQFDVVTGAVVSAALDPIESTKTACAVGQNDETCCNFNGGEDVSNLTLTLEWGSLPRQRSLWRRLCVQRYELVYDPRDRRAGVHLGQPLSRVSARAEGYCRRARRGLADPIGAVGSTDRPVLFQAGQRAGASLTAWANSLAVGVALVAVLGQGLRHDRVPDRGDVAGPPPTAAGARP